LSKPLNEFGGWLSFCKFCVILSFILIIKDVVLTFIALEANLFMHVTNISTQDSVSAWIGVFVDIILVFIQVQILKTLKTSAPVIPTQISKLFIVWLVIVIAMFGITLVMNYFNMLPSSFNDKFNIRILAGLIMPLSWLAYFRWSKRVKAYYGANAFE
jgi:Zn-dependent protease